MRPRPNVLCVYLDPDTKARLEKFKREQASAISVSRLINASVHYWLNRVEKYGVDGTLAPLVEVKD